MAEGEWGGALNTSPIKVTISYMAGLNTQQIGFHVRPVGVTTGDADEVTAAVETWVDEHFRTMLSNDDRVVRIDAVDMTSKLGHSISPSSMFGTVNNAGVKLPAYVCATVSLKGERRTRYGQGRFFLPIRSESWTTDDQLAGAGLSATQPIIDALAAAFIGNTVSGYNLCNVHGVIAARAATSSSPARPEIPPMWHDVTSLTLNTRLTFLRSRKAGVGS